MNIEAALRDRSEEVVRKHIRVCLWFREVQMDLSVLYEKDERLFKPTLK